ncbi:MAG TPA: DUF3768 domain-containing protein [Candidatus Saccharimonadia bacterium]|nr:DUF3768 domain-containing protein [Candidatus Saccharimonadia bacterium]
MEELLVEKALSERIAAANDEFRRSKKGLIMCTRNVWHLYNLPGLIQEIREYENWIAGLDPFHRHDFGHVMWLSNMVFHKVRWSIDYYDWRLRDWEDPLSPDCVRVMSVRLADED